MEKPPVHASQGGQEPNHNRRRFLFGLGAVGAAAAIGTAVYKHFETGEVIPEPEGERFLGELAGYTAVAKLGPNELIFVDEHNVPIGAPVDFSEAIPEDLKNEDVAISPPPLSWRRNIAQQLEADEANGGRKVARSHNVALDFKAALDKGEPALQSKIKSGEVASLLDIVNYYGEKPVRGVSKEISRKDYVREAFMLSDNVPSIVRAELQSELGLILPGLCAQESRFNNNLASPVGARGIFQFMPDVWKSYGKEEAGLNSLKTQTEVAGLLMSDIYRQLMHHIDDETLFLVRDHYDTQSDFLKHFVVPLMVNSYNAGSKRVATAVNEFFGPSRNLEGLTGKNVYLAIADNAEGIEEGMLGRYGSDSREYFSRVSALSTLL